VKAFIASSFQYFGTANASKFDMLAFKANESLKFLHYFDKGESKAKDKVFHHLNNLPFFQACLIELIRIQLVRII